MQTLLTHIQTNCFSQCYLLCGEEEYLKRFYREKLTKSILDEDKDGNMNYHYYEGDQATEDVIAEQALCLPFFSDVMLLVIENSNLFKKASSLSVVFKDLPESTRIIFIEKNIDKRNALYKYIKKEGHVCEINHKQDSELLPWIATYLNQAECRITSRAAKLILSKAGVDMQQLKNELDKLIAFVALLLLINYYCYLLQF